MKEWPKNLMSIIKFFGRMPGIGPKMAERLTLYLLKQPTNELKTFADLLYKLPQEIKLCSQCYTISDTTLCDICKNPKRSKSLLMIVADPVSALTIEKSDTFPGYYFILGGLLNPIEGITPDKLRIKELIDTVKKSPQLKEIIFAFNPTVEGEATILYLKKYLFPLKRKLTRLARGLPMGGDITYTDEITLREAVSQRKLI